MTPTFILMFEELKDDFLPTLKRGEELPSERDMAEKFGVSRAVIREAKAALWAMELISVSHGKPSKKM